jgi:hypothetical protein
MPAQLTTVVVKPLRLNFAGYCLWCGERWCSSARCVASHAVSVWMVCPDCDGRMDGVDGITCHCYAGVIEAARPCQTFPPTSTESAALMPNSPISVPPAVSWEPPAGLAWCPFCDPTAPGWSAPECVCLGRGLLPDRLLPIDRPARSAGVVVETVAGR